jgi:RNA polymerase sigma factor (sigma-70 family)
MLEQDLLALVKSFLAKGGAGATAEERLAWEEFFVTYDVVIRVCVKRIHTAVHVIDDVAQDVWMVLIRRLPRWKFDPAIASIGAWVTKIAQRLAARRARRGSTRRGGLLSGTQADTLVDPEPGPDAEFERMQEHELFGALVLEPAASLHERDGRIVVLRYIECRAVREIARALRISDDCVRSVLHRVLPNLRNFLRRRGLGSSQ